MNDVLYLKPEFYFHSFLVVHVKITWVAMVRDMSFRKNKRKQKCRILFFGRDKCGASKSIYKKLQAFGFEVASVKSRERGEILPKNILEWSGDFILCFRSHFVLPKTLLEKAKIAAINFHPAPPEYPGSGCINFALYDEVEIFGVTAHLMDEYVDSGPILEVRRFPISRFDNLESVLGRTHNELFNLCSDFICELERKGVGFLQDKIELSKNEQWNGRARKINDLNSLQTIKQDVTERELKRIIRATYSHEYPPKVVIHGFDFRLSLD
jgi:methionyl-tRNA formyltransferase